MKKATLDSTSYAWRKLADNWATYFFPPSRPSSEEARMYLEWLRQIAGAQKGLNALVMGATPELRNALNQLGFRTHVIDINMEMILALDGLVRHKNPNEVLIRTNWLDNPLQASYFDVVLGDAVFPNIPWGSRSKLYDEIIRWLKPNGYFINRAFYAPVKKRFENIDVLLDAYAKRNPTNETAIQMVFDIQLLAYDRSDRLGSQMKVKKVVEKLRRPDGFTHESDSLNKVLNIVWGYWLSPSVIDKVWIYPAEHDEEAEYERYFVVENKFCASDHPYGQLTPMYLLRRQYCTSNMPAKPELK